MVGEELSDFGVHFRFGEDRRWIADSCRARHGDVTGRQLFGILLLLLIGVENLQKGLVDIRTPENERSARSSLVEQHH